MPKLLGQPVLRIPIMLLCCAALASAAVAEDWTLKRDRDGIRVYTRAVAESPFNAVRAEAMLSGTLFSVVAIVRDVDVCSEWAALCKLSLEHQIVSPAELYVYTYNDVPWPVSDRDAVTHVVWKQDPATYSISMEATVVSGKVPPKKGVVRIAEGVTRWQFTPQADGKVKAVMEAHVDPSGPTPAWLTNVLLVDAPFDTLQGLRKLLATGRYDEAEFDFFRPPPEPPENVQVP